MIDENCIFCKIAAGKIPSKMIYEDQEFRVILDLSPASKGHTLILPKNHYRDLCSLDDNIAGKILPLARKLGTAMMETLGCEGFNLVQNNGAAAGQTVLHFHLHIIPRYADGPAMVTWNPNESDEGELWTTAEKIKGGL